MKLQDWDEVEALRASLREHMAEIHRLRAAGRQALEALKEYQEKGAPFMSCDAAVATLRAALAEDVRETNFGNMAQTVDLTKADHVRDATKMVPTWRERCETHPDHKQGMVTNQMIMDRMQEEIDELRAVVSQQMTTGRESRQVEPVAWRFHDGKIWCYVNHISDLSASHKFEPLYATPPKRNPMTEQQLDEMFDQAEIAIYIADRQQKEHLEVYSFGVRDAEKWHGIGGEE